VIRIINHQVCVARVRCAKRAMLEGVLR